MQKAEFESALGSAIKAKSKSGTKWRKLERLFGDENLRGGGALNNSPAERRTRIRQLLTARRHPSFTDLGLSRHCVLVLNQESAAKAKSEADYLTKRVVPDVIAERPPLPPSDCMETLLVVDGSVTGSPNPLLLMQWGASTVGDRYLEWYPTLTRTLLQAPSAASASVAVSSAQGGVEIAGNDQERVSGRNMIFFGPPGSGKSYIVEQELEDCGGFVRCVFHPDYAYSDFVGSYKPVTGSDPHAKILANDGTTEINKPVVYYTFEPGPLVQAIVQALTHPEEHYALVIEEINRGDCAAIFGDFFQLLDRKANGASQYGIRLATHVGAYLMTLKHLETADTELFLPANLSVFATMNTSDQSLYAMDAAFKRRWDWKAVPATHIVPELSDVHLEGEESAPVKWLDLLRIINQAIVNARLSGDKRVGAWYIKAEGALIPRAAISNKLLFYLWHDVFRDREGTVFADTCTTFDSVQAAYETGGIRAACAPLFATWTTVTT